MMESIDLSSLIIGAALGAILSLLFTVLWERFNNFRFWLFITRNLIGQYSVFLKNGNKYPDENITWAKITQAKGREIDFEMELKSPSFGNSKGKIYFTSNNFGQGWYQHKINTERYGFAQLIIMSDNQLAFFRKYTTDDDKNTNSFKSIETSFIWKKDSKADNI